MDLSTLDLDALLDELRATNADADAERMIRAFEEVLRLVRDDPSCCRRCWRPRSR